MPQSLMVGPEMNLEFKGACGFQARIGKNGSYRSPHRRKKLCYHFVIDYFVYPKGIWGGHSTFCVGRPGWDIWMLYADAPLTLEYPYG